MVTCYLGVPRTQFPGSAVSSGSNPIQIGGSDKSITSSLGDSKALTTMPLKTYIVDDNAGK